MDMELAELGAGVGAEVRFGGIGGRVGQNGESKIFES